MKPAISHYQAIKAVRMLKWHPILSFNDTVDLTIGWYKDYYSNLDSPYNLTLSTFEDLSHFSMSNNPSDIKARILELTAEYSRLAPLIILPVATLPGKLEILFPMRREFFQEEVVAAVSFIIFVLVNLRRTGI